MKNFFILIMSVNVFGQQLSSSKLNAPGRRGPPGRGFKLTPEGNFDIEKRRLCNLADPEEDSDAVSLQIFNKNLAKEIQQIREELSTLQLNTDTSVATFLNLHQENSKKVDELKKLTEQFLNNEVQRIQTDIGELKLKTDNAVSSLIDYNQENRQKIDEFIKGWIEQYTNKQIE